MSLAPVSSTGGFGFVGLFGVQLVWPVKEGMATISEVGVVFFIAPPLTHHKGWSAAGAKYLAAKKPERWNSLVNARERKSCIESCDQTKM